MDIPTYDRWMLPLLRLLQDGSVRTSGEAAEALADQFQLDAEARGRLLGSGKQPVYRNRANWAATYLRKAGLVASPARGRLRITDAGRKALDQAGADGRDAIDAGWLEQRYPEFAGWRRESAAPHGKSTAPMSAESAATDNESPTETLERVFAELQSTLAADLLERVKEAPPAFFEQVVVDLMRAMGYGGMRDGAGRVTGKSGDGGIDGVIDQDRLGLDKVYLQAKRWDSTVGRPVVQAFSGALEGERASKGVLITTSDFSSEARAYVHRIAKRIVLIDGGQLARLMIQHGVGVSAEMTYVVKRIDGDYFDPT